MKIDPDIIREFIDLCDRSYGFMQGPAYLFEDLDNVTHKFMLYKHSRVFTIYVTRFKSEESIDLDLEELLDLNTWKVQVFCDSDKYDVVRDCKGRDIKVSDIVEGDYDRVFYNYCIDLEYKTIDDIKLAILPTSDIESIDEYLEPNFKKDSCVDLDSVKTYLVNSETGSIIVK